MFSSEHTLRGALIKQLAKRGIRDVAGAEALHADLVERHGDVRWPEVDGAAALSAAGSVPAEPFLRWLRAQHEELGSYSRLSERLSMSGGHGLAHGSGRRALPARDAALDRRLRAGELGRTGRRSPTSTPRRCRADPPGLAGRVRAPRGEPPDRFVPACRVPRSGQDDRRRGRRRRGDAAARLRPAGDRRPDGRRPRPVARGARPPGLPHDHDAREPGMARPRARDLRDLRSGGPALDRVRRGVRAAPHRRRLR